MMKHGCFVYIKMEQSNEGMGCVFSMNCEHWIAVPQSEKSQIEKHSGTFLTEGALNGLFFYGESCAPQPSRKDMA